MDTRRTSVGGRHYGVQEGSRFSLDEETMYAKRPKGLFLYLLESLNISITRILLAEQLFNGTPPAQGLAR